MEPYLQIQENGAIESGERMMNNGGIGANDDANCGGILDGVFCVKVMTDEQLEILRTQIVVYVTISEQLAEMHKAFASQQDLEGARLGNFYCDPLVTSIGRKITVRHRWTPTPLQLQILERVFDEQGTGTPSKQKIKEITTKLSQHGHILETNVYNWFQNRRARSKKKQLNNAQNNDDSEVEMDGESSQDKKTNPENIQSQHMSASRVDDFFFHGQDTSSTMHTLDPKSSKMDAIFASDGSLEPSLGFDMTQLALYESALQNTNVNVGMDELIGKMELPESYNADWLTWHSRHC